MSKAPGSSLGARARKKRFARQVVQGKTIRESAKALGICTNTALKLSRDPEVNLEVNRILDAAGATIEKSARVVAEAHDAKKLQSINFETHEVVDHRTRLDAAELNLKARRILGGNEAPPVQSPTAVILAIIAERQLRGLEDSIPGEAKPA